VGLRGRAHLRGCFAEMALAGQGRWLAASGEVACVEWAREKSSWVPLGVDEDEPAAAPLRRGGREGRRAGKETNRKEGAKLSERLAIRACKSRTRSAPKSGRT
jgi:hypothetical protein